MTRSPARIGYLLRMYPRFSQTFVVNEILELERQGLDLHIASLRKPTDGIFHESFARVRAKARYLPETILSDFRRVCRVHWPLVRHAPLRSGRAAACVVRNRGAEWIDLAQAASLLRWVRKQRIDHVHVHFGTNEATVAHMAHIMGGLSYSMTLHAFDIFRENVDRRLLVRKINASRFTLTVSDFNRRYLLDNFPEVDASRIRVNYNGIDLERFVPGGTERETATLFAVGRLIEKKGFADLVRAVGRLRDQALPVRCTIAGEGREAAHLKQEIKRLRLESHVELAGSLNQQQVRERMRRAACFALPCVRAADGNMDALPTVLLESLASGCPTVSTRLCGVPEIIEDGVSGLLVSPGADAALAGALRRVLTEPALAARLAAEGRRRAEERFDIRHNVRVTHDWLLAAAGRAPARSEPVRASASLVQVQPVGRLATEVP
ncbi:MAG: glycosyltransferase family 4 protein [Phycisphaerae bacterium]